MYANIHADTEKAIKWFAKAKEGVGNLKPMYDGITDDVRYFVRAEFSNQNPNNWMQLRPKYSAWKVKHGFPKTIGVMTGKLKWGATDLAIVKTSRKKMIYQLNQEYVVNKKGRKYAGYFDKIRPIFNWTALRVVSFIKGVTLAHINKQLGKIK